MIDFPKLPKFKSANDMKESLEFQQQLVGGMRAEEAKRELISTRIATHIWNRYINWIKVISYISLIGAFFNKWLAVVGLILLEITNSQLNKRVLDTAKKYPELVEDEELREEIMNK